MKKVSYLLVCCLCLAGSASAQRTNAAYWEYISLWKNVALQQQKDYGVPASITMAQALLESAAGKSELAVQANNHFGIKCTNDWMGGVYYYDDDSKGECFRQYGDAAESFKDHSLFLQRPRYASCFEIAVEDYEGWAFRLRQCGYATDPLYSQKLIKIIEDYRLDSLEASVEPVPVEQPAANADMKAKQRPPKAEVVTQTEPIMVITHDPEPPYVEPATAREERDSFFLSHPKKRFNGVPYVLAREGDTYANVAFRLNMRERDLREKNDALGRTLEVGDRIYIKAKKSKGKNVYVWTYPGQSLWALCQEEAVKMSAVQELNGIDPSFRVFKLRERIVLRKVKEDASR